jgi:hypothetical protein
MIDEARYEFRNFKMEIKSRPLPSSYLVIFTGGTESDSGGWETATGDRKKLEGDFSSGSCGTPSTRRRTKRANM